MRKLCEGVKTFFGRDWTLAEKLLVVVCCILFGILQGVLMAPIKKGISFGNNNGNNYGNAGNTYEQLEDEFWLDDED